MSNTYKPNGTYNDKEIQQDFVSGYDEITSAKDAWETAHKNGDKAGMDAAHARAEEVRAGYGYSGGEDGSQKINNDYGNVRDQHISVGESRAKAEKAAALKSATQLRNKIPGIEQNYDNISQQAYKNYMMEQKSTGEQLSKMGLSGQGLAESTVAGQSSTYQQNVNGAQLAKQDAVNEINAQADHIIAGGDVAAANAKADALDRGAKAYESFLETARQQANWDKNFNQNVAESNQSQKNWEETNRIKKEESDRNNAWKQATTMAQYGDLSGLRSFGMSDAAIRAWLAGGR